MRENKIVVENIKQADLPEIVKLAMVTKELHLQDGKPAYYSVKELKSFIKSRSDIHLAAKVGQKLAGYRLATYNRHLREAYLMDLVVKPEFRGMGVASALYQKTFKLLNHWGCQLTWVLTHEDNKLIQQVLQNFGFTKGIAMRVFFKNSPL